MRAARPAVPQLFSAALAAESPSPHGQQQLRPPEISLSLNEHGRRLFAPPKEAPLTKAGRDRLGSQPSTPVHSPVGQALMGTVSASWLS